MWQCAEYILPVGCLFEYIAGIVGWPYRHLRGTTAVSQNMAGFRGTAVVVRRSRAHSLNIS